jgi:hypothetical protein
MPTIFSKTIFSNRRNNSFETRLKKAMEYTGDYFTPRLMNYWELCYLTSKTKKNARCVLTAFARIDYIFLMNCVIEHLSIHLKEIEISIKPKPCMSITYFISYISLIDFGQTILERLMRIEHQVRELPVVSGKTFVHRISDFSDEVRGRLRIRFKDVLRKMCCHIDSKARHSLNNGGFFIDGDDTRLLIPLDKYLSMCDACNREVCSCSQFTSIDGVSLGNVMLDLSNCSISMIINFHFDKLIFLRYGILNGIHKIPTDSFTQEIINILTKNQDLMRFLWETCDTCQKRVNHLGIWRTGVKCTECGGECPVFLEPTTSPAHASDSLQALETELIKAKISIGEPVQKLANVLLENGVFQLYDLSVLEQSEFESLVQKLELNTLQLRKLRVASGRQ